MFGETKVSNPQPLVRSHLLVFFGTLRAAPEGCNDEAQAFFFFFLLQSSLPEVPAGGFIVVYWRGRPDGVVSVLLLPQRSRGRPRVGVLQPGHLLIDGGLRARFDATARLGLTGPTEKKQQ